MEQECSLTERGVILPQKERKKALKPNIKDKYTEKDIYKMYLSRNYKSHVYKKTFGEVLNTYFRMQLKGVMLDDWLMCVPQFGKVSMDCCHLDITKAKPELNYAHYNKTKEITYHPIRSVIYRFKFKRYKDRMLKYFKFTCLRYFRRKLRHIKTGTPSSIVIHDCMERKKDLIDWSNLNRLKWQQ